MSADPTAARVALVVGGIRGIGLATAEALAADGWRVVAADRDAAEAEVAARFDCRRLDIQDSAAVDAFASRLLADHGRLDGLVNAAGFNRHEAVADLNDATWLSLLDVHIGGVLRCCRALYPALAATRGAVVNFSSINAQIGRPKRAPYAAAKGGIEAMTRTLAIEWAPAGIRVNAVSPGIINTRMVQENLAKGLVDRESLTGAIPLARFGEASEVAAAVAFLLSGKASYITGQTLAVDGGVLANGNW